MTSRRPRAWTAPAALLLAAAAVAVAAPQAAAGVPAQAAGTSTGWRLRLAIHYLPATNRSQYTAVVADRAGVWLFGGSNLAGPGVPVIEFRTSRTWQSAQLPAGLHSWIAGASAVSATDIWAVTHAGGTVLHWDGQSWTAVLPGGWAAVTSEFTGVTALAGDNVWLFDAGRAGHPGAGAWNWDGASWLRGPAIAARVYQASADSPADLWAIGRTSRGLTAVLHDAAGHWTRVRARALAGLHFTAVLAESVRSVWLAGAAGPGRPLLVHWNGSRWTAIAAPGTAPPAGLCAAGAGTVWVAPGASRGSPAMLRYARRGGWSRWPVSASPASPIAACAPVRGGASAWGAGTVSAAPGTAAAAYAFGSVP
jgi:hypothetical protein